MVVEGDVAWGVRTQYSIQMMRYIDCAPETCIINFINHRYPSELN